MTATGQRRVHQILATLGYGDAIGHEVLGIRRALRGAGFASEIVVEAADPRLEDETIDYRDFVADARAAQARIGEQRAQRLRLGLAGASGGWNHQRQQETQAGSRKRADHGLPSVGQRAHHRLPGTHAPAILRAWAGSTRRPWTGSRNGAEVPCAPPTRWREERARGATGGSGSQTAARAC